jgi:hypothetical protein
VVAAGTGPALPSGWDRATAETVGRYRSRLAAGLIGSRRTRTAILAEVTDGLIEAVETYRAGGMQPAAAARATVAEFGDPTWLAGLFAVEQAGVTARRIGLGLVATGPLVGAAWLAAYAVRTGSAWPDQIGVVLSTVPAFAAVLIVGVPAALLAAVADTGPLMRHLALAPRRVLVAAMVAAGATMVGDGTLLAAAITTADGVAAWSWLAVPAVVASMARFSVAAAAAGRCARLRNACA